MGQPSGDRALSEPHAEHRTLGPPAILRNFGFSGDGAEIWFAEGNDSAAPKWLIPLTGGTPRPFMGHGPAAPSWSRDDTRLAYFTNGGGDPISIADRTSANARPLVIDQQGFFASGVHNHNPVWSPDGRWLYFAHGLEPTEEMNVWRVRSSGGTPEQLTTLQAAANHLALVDDSTLLYVARADDRSGPWLWSLDVETKVSRRVISGLEHYTSVSASRDGHRVVTTVSTQTATLWQVPIRDQPAGDRDAQPYQLPRARALSPRFGKEALFYLSGQGAGDGLWRFQEGISSEVEVSRRFVVGASRRVAGWISRRHHRSAGWEIAAVGHGAGRHERTNVGAIDRHPKFRRSWQRRLVSGRRVDRCGWHRCGWSRIVQDSRRWPVTCPPRLWPGRESGVVAGWDSDCLWRTRSRRPRTAPWSETNGAPFELPDLRTGIGGGHRFLPDGKGLVYLSRTQSRDFWLLDLATNRTRALTRLEQSRRGGRVRHHSRWQGHRLRSVARQLGYRPD